MTRTVTDAAKLLDVLVGYRPHRQLHHGDRHHRRSGSFTESIKNATVVDKRIGVLRSAFGDDSDSAGAAVNDVIAHALKELAAAGAELVDVEIPRLDHYVSFTSLYFTRSRDDMNRFFAERPEIGISGVDEVRRNGTYDRHLDLFEGITDGPEDPRADPGVPRPPPGARGVRPDRYGAVHRTCARRRGVPRREIDDELRSP